jgi:hypothetical protein
MEEVTPFGASRSMGPLLTRERTLLAGWERARQSRITRSELVAQFGVATESDVVKGLLRKGVLLPPAARWLTGAELRIDGGEVKAT